MPKKTTDKPDTVASKQAPAATPVSEVTAPRINTAEAMTAEKAKEQGLDGFLFGDAGKAPAKADK